jgi:hypothetical protein
MLVTSHASRSAPPSAVRAKKGRERCALYGQRPERADVHPFDRSKTDLCSMPSRHGSSVSADAQKTRRNGQGRVSDHRDHSTSGACSVSLFTTHETGSTSCEGRRKTTAGRAQRRPRPRGKLQRQGQLAAGRPCTPARTQHQPRCRTIKRRPRFRVPFYELQPT